MRKLYACVTLTTILACGGAQEPPATAEPAPAGPVAAADPEPEPAPAPEVEAAPASSPIPEGFHAVTPRLVVADVAAAVAFYETAFGAELRQSMDGPDGEAVHAEIAIGDSIILLAGEQPEMGARSPKTLGATSGGLMLYVEDVDAVYKKAIEAGAEEKRPIEDMFWGDRFGELTDPFGHQWGVATHVYELSAKETARRAKLWQRAAAKGKRPPKLKGGKKAESFKPERYFTVTPTIVIDGGKDALAFYEKAFDGEVLSAVPAGNGRLQHAEVKIGDSTVMISSEFPEQDATRKAQKNLDGVPFSLMLYVESADGAFARAVEAGAEAKRPVQEMFWGDRLGQVADPSGHEWGIGTRVKDLTPEQIRQNMKKQLGG